MRFKRLSITGAMVALCLAAALLITVPAARSQEPKISKSIQVSIGGSYLGIEMEEVTGENLAKYKLTGERGVIVRSVEKGSPAQEAGLQENDVILEYSGMSVFSSMQFARMVRETPAGRKVDLGISRDGKKLTLSAKLKERDTRRLLGDQMVRILPRGSEEGDYSFEFRSPDGRLFGFRGPDGKRPFVFSPPGGPRAAYAISEKPRLGVTLQPLTAQLSEFLGVPGKKGALVTGVTEASPAAGKLKAGDVIVRANDKAIEDPGDLSLIVRGLEDDAKLELKVIRDKKEITITIQLAKLEEKSKSGGYKM